MPLDFYVGQSMNSEDNDRPLVIAVVVALVALVVGITLIIGVLTVAKQFGKPSTAVFVVTGSTAPAPSTYVTSPTTDAAEPSPLGLPDTADDASVEIESGVVRFYFTSGSAQLAPGSARALRDLIAAVQLRGSLSISGFHDMAGDRAKNRELALQRATAVSDILKNSGVQDSKIVVQSSVQMQGTGSMADARRVEVTLQQPAK